MANYAYLHVNAATIGTVISPNPHAILASVTINTPSTGGSTVLTSANQTGTGAASAITLTVPAVAGQTNQVNSFTVSGLGATSAGAIQITLAGVQGGTQNFEYSVPAGATVVAPVLEVTFSPPLLASGANTAIVLTVPSFGTGNTLSQASLDAQSFIAAGGGIMTLYDGQSTNGKVIAVINTLSTGIPALEYHIVAPGGLFFTLTAGSTTTGDFTIAYV